MDVLGDTLFHDLNYYDLFTRMWLKFNDANDTRFHKSELYQLMPNISQRTAIKYIQIAIDHGLLIEHVDPDDLRSRRITMSSDLKRKIELFLDYSISVFETLRPLLIFPNFQMEKSNARLKTQVPTSLERHIELVLSASALWTDFSISHLPRKYSTNHFFACKISRLARS